MLSRFGIHRFCSRRLRRSARVMWLVALGAVRAVGAQVTGDAPLGRPDAIVDLRTTEGAALVGAQWRYHDAAVVPVAHRAVGADLKPSGAPNSTFDVTPLAGAADYDDTAWATIPATSLEARRGNGRLSFGWYRVQVTLPERLGSVPLMGATVVLEVVVDDYSEIWVDGKLATTLGASGGGVVRGWNAPNRVVLTNDARPGQRIQVAIFGANAPLSEPPGNYVWIRSATVDVHLPTSVAARTPAVGAIERLGPGIDAIVPRDARIEQLASGFLFTEGPVWHPDGFLLFSDPNANTIYRWTPDGAVSVYRAKSGYAGVDVGRYRQPGSNGLTLDTEGRLSINEHGRRRVVRLEKNGTVTVLADRHEGRRLNSPNDLVYSSTGALYFTDPPFGLPQVFDDPAKETPFSGVYRLSNGRLALVARDLTGPNGLAFSPDERWLYVSNWDVQRKVIMRYPVLANGSLGAGTVFVDATTSHPGEQAWDGLKVDRAGNLYAAGPGGIWVIAPDGTRLGTIAPPETPANLAWGDQDGRTLYMTARTGLYRIRLNIPGVRPANIAATTRSTP